MIPVRHVKVSGVVYLRLEDVVSLIAETACTESTDVRDRLEKLCDNIKTLSKPTVR